MTVDRREVERIAALAHLQFDDVELEQFTAELNQILTYVESLTQLGAPEGATTPMSDGASTRPDRGEPDRLEHAPSEIAPHWAEGFFVVPPPPGVQGEGATE